MVQHSPTHFFLSYSRCQFITNWNSVFVDHMFTKKDFSIQNKKDHRRGKKAQTPVFEGKTQQIHLLLCVSVGG